MPTPNHLLGVVGLLRNCNRPSRLVRLVGIAERLTVKYAKYRSEAGVQCRRKFAIKKSVSEIVGERNDNDRILFRVPPQA